MSTTLETRTPGRRAHPLRALSRAEYLQFTRNKTLMIMGTVFPVALPLLMFFVARGGAEPKPVGVAVTLEVFAFSALMLVQYYSVLSMVTTRRSEGVLKRLRTGEATDLQILTAPAVPGALLTAVGTVIVGGIIYIAGGPLPVNIVLMVFAIAVGVVIFSILALATTAMTKNAEAAQITSIPVMMISVFGMTSLREVMPERLSAVADWTPFAAIADLLRLGQAGLAPGAATDGPTLDFLGTFSETGRPLATLALWTVISVLLAKQWFRWDDRG